MEDNKKQKTAKENFYNLLAVSTLSNFNGKRYAEAMEFIEYMKYALAHSSEINTIGRADDYITSTPEGINDYYSKRIEMFYNNYRTDPKL